MLVDAGVATPTFAAVDSIESLHAAVDKVGLPAVIKTRRFGYDGKGQRVLRSADEIDAAWEELGSYPLIAEALVPFVRELSVIAVRSASGEIRVYPLAENHHSGGILRTSIVPAPNLDAEVRAEAHAIAERIMERHDYVGVLTVELFEFVDDRAAGPRLMANEIAPRVHNSGHWSLDGAVTSQFENHVRAVAGLPLGDCSARCACVMENVIGEPPDVRAVLAEPNAKLHMYGKSPREGRKLGHITRLGLELPAP
ncbi:MAG: ATP-grasp domain-containing protein [Planctomycetota bacterium]